MNLEFPLIDLSKDDLVELLSATVCDSWAGYEYRIDGNESVVFEDGDIGFMDKVARCLLQGKKIEVFDRYAKDENADHSSAIEHYWDDCLERCQWEAEGGFMVYRVSLKDIKDGLSGMLNQGNAWEYECAMAFVNYSANNNKYKYMDFDSRKAEMIMQYVLWGKEVYC